MQKRSFWLQWIAANAVGELVGLGLAAAIGGSLALLLSHSSGRYANWGMAVVMILIGTLEGVIVGYAQWLVLRNMLSALSGKAWIGATALGAFIAWFLGMIPSTLMSLQEADSAPPPEINDALMAALAFAMGAILGPILALPQWFVLRRFLAKAGWWIPANAVAWAFGMPLIFFGASAVAPTGFDVVTVIIIAGSLIVAGAVVGAIHGLVLVWLLPEFLKEKTR